MIVIGIDPGTHTGLAVWDPHARALLAVESLKIHRAIQKVGALMADSLLVIFEDARQRHYFTNDAKVQKYGAGVREGVGSVKRDCSIWEEYLEDQGIPYQARKPKSGMTKWDADKFALLTGWTAKTNEHGRDAAAIIHGLNLPMAQAIVHAWEQRHAQASPRTSARR